MPASGAARPATPFRAINCGAPGKACYLIADQVRRAIIEGELQAGDTLPPEAVLMASFQSSRPSVREATRLLEAENLIRVRRGAIGGAVVQAPSIAGVSRSLGLMLQRRGASLMDVYDARAAIEPVAASMAARHRPADAARVLAEVVDRGGRLLADRNDFRIAVDFHDALLTECGNPVLAVLGAALRDLVEEHQTVIDIARRDEATDLRWQRRVTGLKSSRRLVDLIAAGEADAAGEHWVRHMSVARRLWLSATNDRRIDVLSRFSEHEGHPDAPGSGPSPGERPER